MEAFEYFRQQFQHALQHLNDPNFPVAEELAGYVLFGQETAGDISAFQSAVIGAIQALQTGQANLEGSRTEAIYQVLQQRFILGQTQEKTAEALHLSIRSLQRLQREGTHILARHFWQRRHTNEPYPGHGETFPGAGVPEAAKADPGEQSDAWMQQLKRELLLLQAEPGHPECDLGEALAGALRILQASVLRGARIRFEADHPRSSLPFHPTVLRQVFIHLLSELARSAGEEVARPQDFQFEIETDREQIWVDIRAAPYPDRDLPEFPLVAELLETQSGSVTVTRQAEAVVIRVAFPNRQAERAVAVLVVDDNIDLANLYRSYCAGTRYALTHVREGRQVFEKVRALQPDIIMLDILLPDMDGWDLLLDLRNNPLTGAIPIIVCSVVTDRQLVYDLGAALYLGKPVWKEQFLEALGKVSKSKP